MVSSTTDGGPFREVIEGSRTNLSPLILAIDAAAIIELMC